MKVLGFFSGIGMLEHGFKQAGFDVVASNEIDEEICETIKSYSDHEVIPDSIHKLSVEHLRKSFGLTDGEFGIVCGFPCPIYSRAANLYGTRVGVNRDRPYEQYAKLGGDLFLHAFRMIACLQPAFFVIENVPGMLGSNIVRETFRNTPCARGALPTYYKLYEGIENAVNHGLPQNRPRYFFAGSRKKGYLNIEHSETRRKIMVGDILESNVDYEMPDYVKARLAGAYRDRPIITEAGPDAIAPTCVAHYAKDRGTRLVKVDGVIRPYTVREYARLQGIPEQVEFAGSMKLQYTQVGNAVALPVAYSIARGIKQHLSYSGFEDMPEIVN